MKGVGGRVRDREGNKSKGRGKGKEYQYKCVKIDVLSVIGRADATQGTGNILSLSLFTRCLLLFT